MNKSLINGHTPLPTSSDEDFELMGDVPKEDPIITERRRIRNNEISKKLGDYLLKGYCMLSDACPECDCILLRTPDRQLLCVGCTEIDTDTVTIAKDHKETTAGENEQCLSSVVSTNKKKSSVKEAKKRNKKASSINEGSVASNGNTSYTNQLENKLKWAVDELAKSQNVDRINAMCTVIIKLTETIKVLKEYEMAPTSN